MSTAGWTRVASQYRHEDLLWMADTGECASGAAQRLGLSVKVLEKWCRRHDIELWNRLAAAEPVAVGPSWANQYGAAS
jgi:hypothetical protein